jgi:predicted small lipoprotein YifL
MLRDHRGSARAHSRSVAASLLALVTASMLAACGIKGPLKPPPAATPQQSAPSIPGAVPAPNAPAPAQVPPPPVNPASPSRP